MTFDEWLEESSRIVAGRSDWKRNVLGRPYREADDLEDKANDLIVGAPCLYPVGAVSPGRMAM